MWLCFDFWYMQYDEAVCWSCVLKLCDEAVCWSCVLKLCVDAVCWSFVMKLCVEALFWSCVLKLFKETVCTKVVYWGCWILYRERYENLRLSYRRQQVRSADQLILQLAIFRKEKERKIQTNLQILFLPSIFTSFKMHYKLLPKFDMSVLGIKIVFFYI